MITLHQFPPGFDMPVSVSPFCTKLEMYFRLTGRKYKTGKGDVLKSPTRTVPFVRWPEGDLQADSGDIIARLEAKGPSLDAGLSDAEKAAGRALEAEAEKLLYFAVLYARFATPEGWVHQKPGLKKLFPALLSPILTPLIRRSQIKRCRENGFADDSGYPEAVELVHRLSAQLGDKPFMFGDEPRTADCGLWGTLVHAAHTRAANPVRELVRGDANLMAYLDRMAARAKMEFPTPQ